MPAINLNGKFWTLSEISRELGTRYHVMPYYARKYKDDVIFVGKHILIPDDIAQKIMKDFEDSDSKENTIALTMLSKNFSCNINTVLKFVELGLPTQMIRGKPRVPLEAYKILEKIICECKQEFDCVPTAQIPAIMEKFNKEYKGK